MTKAFSASHEERSLDCLTDLADCAVELHEAFEVLLAGLRPGLPFDLDREMAAVEVDDALQEAANAARHVVARVRYIRSSATEKPK